MRRFICISMMALFFLTIVTGFAESHVHPGQSGIHTVMAILFIASTMTHIIINRKAFVRHFVGSLKATNQ
jgi:hypothetical protein